MLDADALEWSLNEIAHRHEILRTTFTTVNGQPIQVIARDLHVPLRLEELTVLPRNERDSGAQRIIETEAQRSFDLASGSLLRAVLVRQVVQEHILLVTMRHILCDAWSLGILIRELGALYEARIRGKPSPLPHCPSNMLTMLYGSENRFAATCWTPNSPIGSVSSLAPRWFWNCRPIISAQSSRPSTTPWAEKQRMPQALRDPFGQFGGLKADG